MNEKNRRPGWLKINLATGENYLHVKRTLAACGLHTVCEEARCPNLHECWGERTATFLILGHVCTRHCTFCAIARGVPSPVDSAEPAHVAAAIDELGLRHAVITSVTRDDLPDGGSRQFARTIRACRDRNPHCTVEVLIPDFRGDRAALAAVLEAGPDVLNHNLETVARLYPRVRPDADYDRSLALLAAAAAAKENGRLRSTKSGIMIGLGENRREIIGTLRDLARSGVDVVTIGQYLSPSRRHLPVTKYYNPAEFKALREEALGLGFRCVEAGPLVRSSYHASRHVEPLAQPARAVSAQEGAS
jgi:lipoic acid synthetase